MTKTANTSTATQTTPGAVIMGAGAHDELLSELLQGVDTAPADLPRLNEAELDQLMLIDGLGLVEAKVIEEPKPVVKVAAKKPTTAKKPAQAKAAAKPADVEPVDVAPVVAPVIEEPAAAPVVAQPTPAQRAPRLTFALQSQKIAHRLGDKAREFLIMDIKDAELSDAELGVKQAALLKVVDLMAVKVGEKASMLFGYLREGGKLNEVMRRTFTVLIADGFLSVGDKGNLITNLEKKPYSIGTCRSQSTQMFQLFPALGICHEREAGKLMMNPDSTILLKMKAELGL